MRVVRGTNWIAPPAGEAENIRVADELLMDLLFAANGQTYESLQEYVRTIRIEDVAALALAF
ncbi:MAG: hypothetical protein ABI330_01010 [Caldimonas sp.]